MTEFQAVVLGVLQGAGEFLPISSSAHLALAPRLFGWQYQGLAYDVMLHLGTLLAVLVYFAKDWMRILRDGLTRPRQQEGRMLWLLAAGSVPAGIGGLLLHNLAETTFRDPRWIAFNLIFFSLFIYLADRNPAQNSDESSFTLKDALIIGLAQTIALMPGASRSGMTIMAALFLGYSRPAAARLSFLLATPVIFGAGLLEGFKLTSADLNAAFAWGVLSSFVSGLAVIGLFMAWLKRRGLGPFLVYRVALGAGILLLPLPDGVKAPREEFALLAPSREAPDVFTGTFKAGQSLEAALGHGVPYTDVFALEKALRRTGTRFIRPGDVYAVSFATSGALADFRLARGEEVFSVSRAEGGFASAKSALPVTAAVLEAGGTLQSSLWEAMSASGVPPGVIMDFADIFAWEIDFLTEPRKGDRFALVWEARKTALGAPCGARIIGAAYTGAETGEARGFYYGGSYYDEKGASLRRAFLRAPLSYRRISSYFSRARFHPVLRIYRPHNGIDYAAASGTPVSAVSDGTVVFKGRKGGYGNFIELKHGGAYTSGYGHLRGFAKGLRTGARVNQGDVIGYVGMTGLATGPHLDFSFKVNGKFTNFLKFNPPAAESLKGEHLRAFDTAVPAVREKLERLLAAGEQPKS